MTDLELIKVGKGDPLHYGFEGKILEIKQTFEQKVQWKWDLINEVRGELKFPEARGHLKAELVNCGKPRCKKCQHMASHGPYWFLYQREGGQLRKVYLGKKVDPKLLEGIKNRTANRPRRKSIRLILEEISRLEREKEKKIRTVRRMQCEVEAKLKLISS